MIDDLCNDIHKLFLSGTNPNNQELYKKVRELTAYMLMNTVTPDILETVIALERKIMASKGPSKRYVETQILNSLSICAMDHCSPAKAADDYLLLNEELILNEDDPDEQAKYAMALKLVNFAQETFDFKMTRDSLSNKRRALLLEILGALSEHYEMPAALDLCLFSLKSKKKDLIYAALEFQENYTRFRDVGLSTEILELLDKIILQTKDRSVAVGALNLQVETGEIDEFEALSRIDDWKDKNGDW